jgi:protein-S-isoprenylcysteine O-methyltransferase Ste14
MNKKKDGFVGNPPIWRELPKRILQIIAMIAVMDAILLGAARRLDWPAAWILSLFFGAFWFFFAGWAVRNAPDLLVERSRTAENVKPWDKAIMAIYTVLLFAMLVVAGVDAGRGHWSAVPTTWQVIGFVGLIPTGLLIWWATSVNRFLSRWARIQDDRNQYVVSTGPYQYVRHPMYAAVLPFVVSIPLALGSWLALIPGGMICILFVVRTGLEDRMLRDELPGYREYAGRVRYRLLPGVW